MGTRVRRWAALVRSAEGAALAITLIALALRLIRIGPVWGSSDAADLPRQVSHLVCRPGGFFHAIREAALYRLGGVEPLLLFLQMSAMHALHLRVTELGWTLLDLLAGTGAVYLAFLLVREFGGVGAGIAAACLFAVCPTHVMESRHLAAPWMYEQSLQLFLVYSLVRLANAPTRALRVAFHVALATYFWAGNQMLGILPVLAYGFVAAAVERDRSEKAVRFLSRRYGGPSALFPAISALVLLYATFVLHEGHLAHALFDKRHRVGFYFDHWLGDVSSDIGPAVTWFGLASVLVASAIARRLFTKERLLVVLFVCYAGPFWSFVPPGSTLTRGYVVYGIGALLLVLASSPWASESRSWARYALPGFSALVLLAGTGQAVYELYSLPILSAKGFQGSYSPDNGVKAAALWIRNRPPSKGFVFSDAAGGGGLEPPLVELYFQRPYLAMYDAVPANRPYVHFKSRAADIDYLLVLPQNRPLVHRYFRDEFVPAVRITDGMFGERLLVYARKGTVGAMTTLDVAGADPAFDAKYSLLCGT